MGTAGDVSLSDLRHDEEAALAIEVCPSEHDVVVTVSGEIDLSTVAALRSVLESVEPASGRLVLDLSDVSFLDSMGVGLLVEAARRCASELRELVLRAPSERVRQVLEITGLHQIVPIVAA